ncbi:TPA: hypothetical protein ACX3DI_004474 [Vibrio parahaemolyticus]
MLELDDRIEFNFCPPQIRDIYGEDRSRFSFLKLRWEGELQDDWSVFEQIPDNARCKAVVNKGDVLNSEISVDVQEGVNQYLFFSEDAYSTWLQRNISGIFDRNCCLNSSSPIVIWLGFGDVDVKGERLSIISLSKQSSPIFNVASGINIPSSDDVKAQTHFVGQAETVCEPLNYRLPRDIDVCPLTQPFYNAYEQLLAVSLSKEFLGSNSIVVSGIKRLSLKLVADNHVCDTAQLGLLESVVSWVYEERTQVRLLLVMDRISLDLADDCCFIPSIYSQLTKALEQAKDKYEFVIKDRKEAHAKEISDFQKDIKSATDGYSKSTNDLVSGLFKDALSAIFFLAIMLFSRLIGKEDLLDSENIHWLFKILSVYLLLSPVIRIYFERQTLSLSLGDLEHWKDTTRNHISHKEVKDLIDSRTKPYKCLYRKAMLLVFGASIILSIFAWNIPRLMNHAAHTEEQVEQVEQVSKPQSTN